MQNTHRVMHGLAGRKTPQAAAESAGLIGWLGIETSAGPGSAQAHPRRAVRAAASPATARAAPAGGVLLKDAVLLLGRAGQHAHQIAGHAATVCGQLAAGREAIDQTRQHLRGLAQQSLRVHAELAGQFADHVAAQGLLQLVGADRQVLAGPDPALHHLTHAVLLKLAEHAAQATSGPFGAEQLRQDLANGVTTRTCVASTLAQRTGCGTHHLIEQTHGELLEERLKGNEGNALAWR